MMTQQFLPLDMFANHTIVRIYSSMWAGRRDVPSETDDEAHGKFVKMIPPKAFSAVSACKRRIERLARHVGVHCAISGDGCYLIPNSRIVEVTEAAMREREEFDNQVAKATGDDAYAALKQYAKDRLTEDEMKMFPAQEELAGKFKFGFLKMVLGLPTGDVKAAMSQYNAVLDNEADDMYGQVCEQVIGAATKLYEEISVPGKKLYDSVWSTLIDLLARVPEKNIFKDETLNLTAEAARAVLGQTTLERLRTDKDHRVAMTAAVGEIIQEFRALAKPSRHVLRCMLGADDTEE